MRNGTNEIFEKLKPLCAVIPEVVIATHSVKAGLLFSQLSYWNGVKTEMGEEFSKPVSEICRELRLTRQNYRTAIRLLRDYMSSERGSYQINYHFEDTRRIPFSIKLLDCGLSHEAVYLLSYLIYLDHQTRGKLIIRRQTIFNKIGLRRHVYERAMRELEKRGLITHNTNSFRRRTVFTINYGMVDTITLEKCAINSGGENLPTKTMVEIHQLNGYFPPTDWLKSADEMVEICRLSGYFLPTNWLKSANWNRKNGHQVIETQEDFNANESPNNSFNNSYNNSINNSGNNSYQKSTDNNFDIFSLINTIRTQESLFKHTEWVKIPHPNHNNLTTVWVLLREISEISPSNSEGYEIARALNKLLYNGTITKEQFTEAWREWAKSGARSLNYFLKVLNSVVTGKREFRRNEQILSAWGADFTPETRKWLKEKFDIELTDDDIYLDFQVLKKKDIVETLWFYLKDRDLDKNLMKIMFEGRLRGLVIKSGKRIFYTFLKYKGLIK